MGFGSEKSELDPNTKYYNPEDVDRFPEIYAEQHKRREAETAPEQTRIYDRLATGMSLTTCSPTPVAEAGFCPVTKRSLLTTCA